MSVWSTFPRDWWRFIRGPGSFLASQDLTSKATLKRAIKYLLLGTGGVVAFSKVNLKFSSYAESEASQKFFEGRALAYAVALGCVTTALVAHFIARLFKGTGTIRQTSASFLLTYAFVWPTTALVLISTVWFIRLSTGLNWNALPPFDVPINGPLERTTGNVVAVAITAIVYLWFIGFLLYSYRCAVSAAHKLSASRSFIVVVLVMCVVISLQTPLAKIAYAIAETFEPLIKWLSEL